MVSSPRSNSLFSEPVRLTADLEDRTISTGVQSFEIPANAFVHSDPGQKIELEAKLADGSALPSFIQFNSETGSFLINADAARMAGLEEIVIQVIGHDNDGNEAAATFTVTLTAEKRVKGAELPAVEGEPVNAEEGEPAEGKPQAVPEQPAEKTAPSPQSELELNSQPSLAQQLQMAARQGFQQQSQRLYHDLMALLNEAA